MKRVRNEVAIITGAKCIGGLLGLMLILLTVGCNSGPQPAPDTRAADEALIRRADADWAKAAQTKQVDAWVAFYADDATVLPPNDKTASDKQSIRKATSDLLGLPGLAITWQPTKIEVARSGDLAYDYGTYELVSNDASGNPTTERGKYLEVWKKQADGNWKCTVDAWSPDLPAPATPPSK
jgi:ketosteroid isomerase-like protein